MTTLETPRLRLRLPEATDAQAMMEIHQDPEARKTLAFAGSSGGVDVAWRNIAMMLGHWQLRGYGQWAVVERATGEVIGRVGLWNPEGWPGIELGWIVRRDRWGRGLGTEAAERALRWTWDEVDTDHIISLIQPGSAASIRVAEKIGQRFEREATFNGATVHVYGVHRNPV